MFFDYCTVLYDDESRVRAHHGLQRHGVDRAEMVLINTVLDAEIFDIHLAGAGEDIYGIMLRDIGLHFLHLLAVGLMQIVHCDECYGFFGF